ncbi:MAG TPA: DUF134 domain-containing protein [Syntrophales bacterium]|nr:DUF134 domain-containing protein [Syntrophales bacterium]
MTRPKCCRRVAGEPPCQIFRPAGVPASALDYVVLSMDEFEAIRLADLEGLYHDKAAERMKVSRQTFGRIIEAARQKVAQALVRGLALRIEGGEIEMAEKRIFRCMKCRHTWGVPFGTGRPAECPACNDAAICRDEGQRRQRGCCEARPRGRP